jgi:hypothetical protein
MPKKSSATPDHDRMIVETARRRIAESLPTIPLERIQDIKILADIIDACLKRTDRTPDAPDPLAALLSLVRGSPLPTGSEPDSPTRSGGSDAGSTK